MQLFSYLGVNMTPRLFLYILFLVGISFYVIYTYNKLDRPYQNLGLLVFISAISELISQILKFEIGTSSPSYHFLIPILIVLQGLIYLDLINPQIRIYRIIQFVIIVFVSTCIINSAIIQKITDFPSFSFTLLAFFTVVLSLSLSRKMLVHTGPIPLFMEERFWFNIGNFLFYPITYFILAFMEFYIQPEVIKNYLWLFDILFVLNLVLYTCYLIAIRVNYKKNINGK